MPVKHNLLTSNFPEVQSHCTSLEGPFWGQALPLLLPGAGYRAPMSKDIIPATNTLKQKQSQKMLIAEKILFSQC